MRIFAFVVASLFVTVAPVCSAQMTNMADDTQALKTAKKVAVFINLDRPAAARWRPDLQRAKKQMTEKLRKEKLSLVQNPADADIVLVVREFNSDSGGGTSVGTSYSELICLGDELKVYSGGKIPSADDPPIWSVSEACGLTWPLNRAMDKLAKAMR